MTDTTDTIGQLESLIRERVPRLKELSEGCRIRYPSSQQYAEADALDNPEYTEATVMYYAESVGYDDGEVFLHVFNEWSEFEDISDVVGDDELEIIGHPILLSDVCGVLEAYHSKNQAPLRLSSFHEWIADIVVMWDFSCRTLREACEANPELAPFLLSVLDTESVSISE